MVYLLALLVAASASPDGGASDAGADAAVAPSIQAFDLRWSRVAKPSPGPALAVGQPGAGCVQGAEALPLRGAGWTVVHPERHRNFGHPVLIAFLRKLAAQARREKLAPPAPSVVDLRSKKMLSAWTPEVVHLLEVVATNPAVDRIFVHPSVKRALCQDKTRRGPWLRLLRPWWGHQDHFHVRLRCPVDSPDCAVPQPLPASEGCDASLDWWFSADATQTAAKRKPPGEDAPAMPKQCEGLLEAGN